MSPRLSLEQFVTDVRGRCLAALEDERFSQDQRDLLRRTLEHFFGVSSPDDWGQPLGLYYAIYRHCGAERDDLARLLAQFVSFYIASADLFDDVQDDDLNGKPHEDAGGAIAINSALTLLSLALDALGKASALEHDEVRRLRYLRVFNRVSLIAVGAQHLDLRGIEGARSRAEVERMHRGKTSSVALVSECAALAGGATPERAAIFYRIGEELAAAIQVIDDVRDLVSGTESLDLKSARSTYPLACFFELAEPHERDELSSLLDRDCIDLDRVRELLFARGTFDLCAEAVEKHRAKISEHLASVGPAGGHLRLLQQIVDHLAEALYEPPPAPALREGTPGPFAQKIQDARSRFLTSLGFPSLEVQIAPWHLPHFLYVPEQKRIYVSDLDTLSEEILPFHSALLDLEPEETSRCLSACAPFLIVHELVHALRDAAGCLGEDAWHEEFVANQVAYNYLRDVAPQSVRAVRAAAQRTLARSSPTERRALRAFVDDCRTPRVAPRDYGCDPREAAFAHAEMILEFAASPGPLAPLVATWLRPSPPLAAE